MRRTEALKIITRVLKQPVDDVPAADLIYGRALAHIEAPGPETPKPWAMQVDVLALRIAAQLDLDEAERGRSTAGRTMLIACALRDLIPGADPACLSVEVKETLSVTGCVSNTWSGTPDGLAERIAAAVWGDAGQEASPLAQAEDAKRARDLVGEVGILMSAGADLESAPWHPVRPGDLVHVHYETAGTAGTFGETYMVAAGQHGFLSMQLLAHTLPEGTEFLDGMVGNFAVEDDPDPLMELWFEAGPHRLTIVRDGRPVHIGGAR